MGTGKSFAVKGPAVLGATQSASAMYVQPSPHWLLGQRYAQRSIVTGLFGLVFLGIILGPAAIRHARKAESFNVVAVFGKTLGIIDTCLGLAVSLIVTYKLFAPAPVVTWVQGAPDFVLALMPWV